MIYDLDLDRVGVILGLKCFKVHIQGKLYATHIQITLKLSFIIILGDLLP